MITGVNHITLAVTDLARSFDFYVRVLDGHRLEIHVGDLGTRLAAMKARPWTAIEFFEE